MNMSTETNSVNHTIIGGDDASSTPSSPESPSFDDSDLLSSSAVGDYVTSQLAAAGPIGVAAAAAIATGKRRKKSYIFETNPSIRKRQQSRLQRKLKAIIDEYRTRVGQQAIVLIATPGKPQNNFKVFGAHPLENVVRSCRHMIVQELESALAEHVPPQHTDDISMYELPPLVIDGIPTPVEKMTQAQLRAFIPLMLKYSTGRGKPGWGKESTRPPWWPKDVPWANVRSDARNNEEKQKVSWTHALRQIVMNCYKYHGREDLMPAFNNEEEKDKGKTMFAHPVTHYSPTMVQTINNSDGTVSVIQVEAGNTVVTLPEGTQAQFQALNAIPNSQRDVHTLAEVAVASQQDDGETRTHQVTPLSVDLRGEVTAQAMATLAEATLSSDGQIILTGEDGTQTAFPVSGMVTIPVSMYQTVVTSISQLTEGQASHEGLMAHITVGNSTDTSGNGTRAIDGSDRINESVSVASSGGSGDS
ncbi:nuclear respiratory factor 1-like [Limulus polyphemus]|uniref:Nuclear respiratory factor 1-like n=1 Tax=Limulus polyphemus TaxID=6850 RepID=A0ABM1B3A9_LIMPO|nr:nuclear respiratory factor 1-like [Limulus polyphemus]